VEICSGQSQKRTQILGGVGSVSGGLERVGAVGDGLEDFGGGGFVRGEFILTQLAGDDDVIRGRVILLRGAGELEFADAGVVPAARDQIGVASALDDLAVVHDEQQVRLTDG